MPPSRSPNGFPTLPWAAAFGRPHLGHIRSVGEEYVPQWTHLYPSRSATLIGASFGSIRSPSGPTRRKWRRWFAAIRARATASSWPTTRFSGSSGIEISDVLSKSSRPNPSSAASSFVRAIRSTPDLRREVAPRPDLDPGRLLRDRAHLRADDGVHVHLGRDVEDPLRDDPVEHHGAGVLLGRERPDELPHRDLRQDDIRIVEEPGGRRATELHEHVAVLLELRVQGFRRRRERRGCALLPERRRLHGPRLNRPRLDRPRFRPSLGAARRSAGRFRLRELGFRLVPLAREAVHLDVLVRGDLVPQALHDLFLRELLDLLAAWRARDEVDFRDLQQLLQDEVAAAVSVDEGREGAFFRELLDRLRDVRPFDRDRVLDPRAQQVQDVLTALDDDDRIAVRDVRPGGQALGPERDDLGHLDAHLDLVQEVGAGRLRLLDHLAQERPRAFDDLVAFRHADVLDLVDADRGFARPDAVDRLERRRQDRRLDLVERGRDEDRPLAPPFLALHVDLDAADASALLQVPQVQFFS